MVSDSTASLYLKLAGQTWKNQSFTDKQKSQTLAGAQWLTGMDMLIKQFINLSIFQYVVAFFSQWKPTSVTSQPSKKNSPFELGLFLYVSGGGSPSLA